MFSRNKVKFIKSLQIKKFRKEYNQFLVEGAKSTLELLHSDFLLNELYVSERFKKEHVALLNSLPVAPIVLSEKDLSDISSFSTNNAAVAIATCKENLPLSITTDEYALVLDDVRDPGNLGTIIRIADWYGITKIICSPTTADCYNPKVISASMGSFTRVSLYYCSLETYLPTLKAPILAADLDGKNVHSFSFPKQGYLLMGNESEGVHDNLLGNITDKVHIPRFGEAESLNVAVATAIICDNLKRREQT